MNRDNSGAVPDISAEGRGFVLRTIRSGAVVTGFVLIVLLSYGQKWAALPVASGYAFAAMLLFAMDLFVRAVFTPDAARESRRTGRGKNRVLVLFALVRYPLIGALLFFLVRGWSGREVIAFAGGFILLQIVIGLRAMGRVLMDSLERGT